MDRGAREAAGRRRDGGDGGEKGDAGTGCLPLSVCEGQRRLCPLKASSLKFSSLY